jgi:hypothetical protein
VDRITNISYKPATFLDVFQKRGTRLGPQLWRFLTEPENIIRLETASELGRPAIEGVAVRLEEIFGNQIKEDRVRQMIGHMVRQIMEHGLGFVLSNQNVKVRVGVLFSRASKYRRL